MDLGFDFTLQPSLDKKRILALAGLTFRDVVATALPDRLLHHAVVIQIGGSSYRLRQHADLLPEHPSAPKPHPAAGSTTPRPATRKED